MRKILTPAILIISVFSCSQKNGNSRILAGSFIDSIIKHSDSSYEKPYYRTDFVTASYYVNKKDSTICQMMKDSAGKIRQVIISKKDTRIFFGSYYKNGQLQADLPLDSYGQYHGTGKFFYEDGSLQSTGNYTNGFKTGEWKVYDEKGKVTATDSYDSNGNIIPQKIP
jgi:antitoxin component YwqK of YwqJK toxin-antitoxin module